MNHKKPKQVILFLWFLAAVGCSKSRASESHPSIIGGSLPDISSPARSSTVALVKIRQGHTDSYSIFCSGTLIAKNLVITASHCLDGRDASGFKVLFGTSDKDSSATIIDVLEFKLFTDDWSKFSPNLDVAWVKLKQDAPPDSIPIEIFHDYNAFTTVNDSNQRFLLAGFGNQKTTCVTEDCVGTKLEVPTQLRDPIYRNSRLMSILVFGKTPLKGICNGDSGGPAFYKFHDKWYLIGALNGNKETLTPNAFQNPEQSCESGESIYGFVGDYAAWIEETSGVTLAYDEDLNQRQATIAVMPESERPQSNDFASWFAYNNYLDEAWYTVDNIIRVAATASEGEDRLAMYRDPHRVIDYFKENPTLELVSVTDIRPILGLPLESLYLVLNDLSAYSLLAQLKHLRILKIAPGLFQSGSFDASFINELKELRYLSLSDLPSADLTKINWQEMSNLRELHLNNLGIDNLDFLEGIPLPSALSKVYIDHKLIRLTPPLAN